MNFLTFAPAQTASSQFPAGILELNDGWRVRSGDNPAWAQPSFNDTSWAVENLTDVPLQAGLRWYRRRIDLPAQNPPLALLIVAPGNDYEVYVNGRQLLEARIRSTLRGYSDVENALPLPVEGGTIQIAIRLRFRSPDTEAYGESMENVAVGPASSIDAARKLARDQRLIALLPSLAISMSLIMGGLGFLLLFLRRRNGVEYLWLGLFLVASGIGGITFFGTLAGSVPNSWNNLIGDLLNYPTIVFQIEFVYAFARRRVDWFMRVYEILSIASILFWALEFTHLLGPHPYLFLESAATAPAAILIPLLLLIWFVRGNREAGWLIVPSLLTSANVVIDSFAMVPNFFHWDIRALLGRPILIRSVPINLTDLFALIYLLAIGVVMALRFTRVSTEQARAAAELDAARDVQQSLVPTTLPELHGCKVEAAYFPAQEVGGDFYQVIQQPDGSTLIAVGDVSGKGLRAAMTGARAIGALRAISANGPGPGSLLYALNREIQSAHDAGFITCLCASLSPGGTVTLANAGHLAPYRNGREIALESGLPLGIAAEVFYPETTLHLSPGDTLTLLSDGVVEARNSDGQLFGFDRTAAISAESAANVAHAAQHFGQEDDITVLTLSLAPVPVVPA